MTWAHLLDLANEGSLQRGRAYARGGRVTLTHVAPDLVRAEARGTTTYDVVLADPGWSCSCPVGVSGAFCKHAVATALLADDPTLLTSEPIGPSGAGDDEGTELQSWLSGLDRDGLLATLADVLQHHPEALDTVASRYARSTGDVAALKGLVDSLATRRRYLDWRESNEHGRHAHQVVDALQEALGQESAAGLLPLLQRAVELLVRVCLKADDSSGILGDAVGRVVQLHAQAARWSGVTERQESAKLVRWLVRWGLVEQDLFDLDIVEYADALGPDGVAAYRREVEKILAKRPEDWSAGHALKRVAVAEGDPDQIVAVVGGDLAGPHAYLALVDALAHAGHDGLALRYALEGLQGTLVPHQSITLYDTAARMLHERGELDRCLALRREQLARIPTPTSYAALHRAAEDLRCWPPERLDALDVLMTKNFQGYLEVLLGEKQVDLAWSAAAGASVSPALRLQLLRARGPEHPEEVLDDYEELVEQALVPTGQQHYRTAVGYLGELRRFALACGQPQRYADLVARLLVEQQRRPTLVQMLRRLPPG